MDPSQGHLKWPVTPSQRTPAVGTALLGSVCHFCCSCDWQVQHPLGRPSPSGRPGSDLRGTLQTLVLRNCCFRAQWGCLDGTYYNSWVQIPRHWTQGVLFSVIKILSSHWSSPLAPWGCVVSSKLCNSVLPPGHQTTKYGYCHQDLPVIPYMCFLEGQGRGDTWVCVGRGPFLGFHLTLSYFLHFYWKHLFLISIRLTRAKYLWRLCRD